MFYNVLQVEMHMHIDMPSEPVLISSLPSALFVLSGYIRREKFCMFGYLTELYPKEPGMLSVDKGHCVAVVLFQDVCKGFEVGGLVNDHMIF